MFFSVLETVDAGDNILGTYSQEIVDMMTMMTEIIEQQRATKGVPARVVNGHAVSLCRAIEEVQSCIVEPHALVFRISHRFVGPLRHGSQNRHSLWCRLRHSLQTLTRGYVRVSSAWVTFTALYLPETNTCTFLLGIV